MSALKSVLMDQGAKPATTNHVLSAVRGTLKEAFLLGLIDAETRVQWPPVRVRCPVAFSLSATFAHEKPARRCSMIAASVSCSPWCHARRPSMNWKP